MTTPSHNQPPLDSSAQEAPPSSCPWVRCLKKPCLGYALLVLIVVGGIWWWYHQCSHCHLKTLETQIVALQKNIDQVDTRIQAQDFEGVEQRHARFGERLSQLEDTLRQTQTILSQVDQKNIDQSQDQRLSQMQEHLQKIEHHSLHKSKETLQWVRLALLIQSGQPFSSLWIKLEPAVKALEFPQAWIQDMATWSQKPTPTRDRLMMQGYKILKHHKGALQNVVHQEKKVSVAQEGVGAWIKNQWDRLFSLRSHHEQESHELLFETLEDMVQHVEEKFDVSSESHPGLRRWLSHAQQRIQLDRAAEALWGALLGE